MLAAIVLLQLLLMMSLLDYNKVLNAYYAYVLHCLVVSDCLWPPWTIARQAPLSMEFSRQECWSGLPFPTLGDLPDSGIKLVSPALASRFFTAGALGKLPPGSCLSLRGSGSASPSTQHPWALPPSSGWGMWRYQGRPCYSKCIRFWWVK